MPDGTVPTASQPPHGIAPLKRTFGPRGRVDVSTDAQSALAKVW
eukprot:CAMPEP_0174376214 /NCGR_PEP_ID=MMETSP0811_2-20130205/117392_1 /TAXON_ID=73025 ORGANISM="Eutreptiella gymnastica-like, Strain CCMP1594" /NCGR_SAMPLE_ID=MMETSP0811_2 /ASSEMBLY_ACC=CAM_ASM_000667 /LENGTH=43 /DNA_ID= /DNA_START= /DNA_END= /DNA_ORIENTATION=